MTNTKHTSPAAAPEALPTSTLLSYFIPELITATIVYILLDFINFRLIACTNIAMCNATVYVTNSLVHLLIKLAEGFSIGLVIICGQHNGAREFKKSGRVFSNALQLSAIIGGLVSLGLYVGAPLIYSLYDVPPAIANLGIPYLQTRSLGVFFLFLYYPFIGFLRGMKNPTLPMIFFAIGAVAFLFFDYALIFGAWGFPELGLYGSAIAHVIQYGVMLLAALIAFLWQADLHHYGINFLLPLRPSSVKELLHISIPVMLDKASLALGPIWLNKMIGCVARCAPPATSELLFNSLTILKTTERIGLLPAIAFAQVITYVVSNDYRVGHFTTIRLNISKVLTWASGLVLSMLILFNFFPGFFLGVLGVQNPLNDYTLATLKLLVVIALFDIFQLILAASLRGAADVRYVMLTRVIAASCFLLPFSYLVMWLPFDNIFVKFMILYASLHMSKALMVGSYIKRFLGTAWKKQSLQG